MIKGLEEGEPFLLAILRRSEVEFYTHIDSTDSELLVTLLRERRYTESLASWPTGLRIFTSTGSIREEQWLMDDIWHIAVQMEVMDSMEIMLPFANDVSMEDWYCANRSVRIDMDEAIIEDLERWSEFLESLARRLLPYKNAASRVEMLEIEDFRGENSVYHTWSLDLVGAKSAWRAGHRSLNSVKFDPSERFLEDRCGTPLWFVSITLGLDNALVEWLMDHGADPFWTHPIFMTTPAHNLCRHDDALRSDAIRSLLLVERPDHCSCHCSQGGCLAIGRAILQHRLDYFYTPRVALLWFALVDGHRKSTWMSSAILRAITFKELSLTHTCCYRVLDEVHGKFSRPTPEEAEVIHDHERKDIERLDELVAKFEVQWAAYTKPFVTFMNREWRPRMRAVRQERQMDKQSYEAELFRIGVTLKAPVCDSTSQSGRESESDSESEPEWPDDYESDGDNDSEGWYTTDEEEKVEGQLVIRAAKHRPLSI